MQPGAVAAFHGLEVDFGQLYAAAGDELVLEHTLAVDLELGRGELGGEGLQRRIADVGPRRGGRDAGGDHKAFPEALGHGNRAEGGDLLAGVLFADD